MKKYSHQNTILSGISLKKIISRIYILKNQKAPQNMKGFKKIFLKKILTGQYVKVGLEESSLFSNEWNIFPQEVQRS